MPPQSVIIHERLAHWSRQLRPRFSGVPIRWTEARSGPDLLLAARASNCPIVIFELDGRPSRSLEDLDSLLRRVPSALTIVIEPLDREEVTSLAREIGATIVLGGVVVPPSVESLLHRWLPLAKQRAEQLGWSPPTPPEPEPWEQAECAPGIPRTVDL